VSDDVTVIGRSEYDEVLSELFTRLWDCDVNCCEPGTHYSLDLQGNITVYLCILVKRFAVV